MGCCPSKHKRMAREALMSPTERPPQEGKADLIVSGAGMAWDKMEGLKADGEVTDLGELFEELQCMFRDVKVEALVQVDGPVLKMIENGSIALVRGKYLMHLADTSQPIPRRQEAPSTAFWPRDEAAKLFRRSRTEFRKPGPDLAGLLFLGLFLVAFS